MQVFSKDEKPNGKLNKLFDDEVDFLCLRGCSLRILTFADAGFISSHFAFAYLWYFSSDDENLGEVRGDFGNGNGESTKLNSPL